MGAAIVLGVIEPDTDPVCVPDRRVRAWRDEQVALVPPGTPVLPQPPTDAQKYRYVHRNSWILTMCAIASCPLLLYSQVRLMAYYPWFLFCVPFVLLGALLLALPVFTDGLGGSFDLTAHKRVVASWRPPRYPVVDVFLPVRGEPLPVLRNTWTQVAAMMAHYQGTVVPYVLDDSASAQIEALATEFGFGCATRPNVSCGEYILLLDVGFAPRPDLLDETLPYLEADPATGIVQTPRFCRVEDDQTWVERGAGAVTELFYRSIQLVRGRKGGAICVSGCTVYRRTALAGNNGMTLANHSEQVLTEFDLNSVGWKLRYIPVALSTGTCPADVVAFFNQQYRWCAGTIGLLFGRRFWRAPLSLRSRLCYLAGLVYYGYTAVFTFAVPLLTITILAVTPQVVLPRNMAFVAPALVYSVLVFPGWQHGPYRLEAWAVQLIAGWAHVFASWDTIRRKPLGWRPTDGDRRTQDGGRRFWACFIVWTAGSSAAWVGLALWRMMTMSPANFAVLFGLGVFEVMIAARVLIAPAGPPPGP